MKRETSREPLLAQRGAVVGPLVVAGAVCEEKDLEKLKAIGVKDSKLLTPEQREKIYSKLKKILKDWACLKISAQQIDELRKIKNLNVIEAEHMAQIIKALGADVAYVDAPQVSTEKFKNVLLALAKNHTKIISENYADKKYVIVGAASILAKVERDAEIKKIKKLVGEDFGVGYSHDQNTRKFVEKCLREKKHLEWIRHSWETVKEMNEERQMKSLKNF